jgi:hypothetical protein
MRNYEDIIRITCDIRETNEKMKQRELVVHEGTKRFDSCLVDGDANVLVERCDP